MAALPRFEGWDVTGLRQGHARSDDTRQALAQVTRLNQKLQDTIRTLNEAHDHLAIS